MFVRNRGWVQACNLRVGDQLLSESGNWVELTDVFDNGDVEPVYNFEVEDFHSYYVGIGESGEFVLVHNTSFGIITAIGGVIGGVVGFVGGGLTGEGGWDWSRAWAGAASGALVGAGIGLAIDTWGAATPLSAGMFALAAGTSAAAVGAGAYSSYTSGLVTSNDSVKFEDWAEGAVVGGAVGFAVGFTGGYALASFGLTGSGFLASATMGQVGYRAAGAAVGAAHAMADTYAASGGKAGFGSYLFSGTIGALSGAAFPEGEFISAAVAVGAGGIERLSGGDFLGTSFQVGGLVGSLGASFRAAAQAATKTALRETGVRLSAKVATQRAAQQLAPELIATGVGATYGYLRTGTVEGALQGATWANLSVLAGRGAIGLGRMGLNTQPGRIASAYVSGFLKGASRHSGKSVYTSILGVGVISDLGDAVRAGHSAGARAARQASGRAGMLRAKYSHMTPAQRLDRKNHLLEQNRLRRAAEQNPEMMLNVETLMAHGLSRTQALRAVRRHGEATARRLGREADYRRMVDSGMSSQAATRAIERAASSTPTSSTRSLDDILVDGRVPTQDQGFEDWFWRMTPDEIEMVHTSTQRSRGQKQQIKKAFADRLRGSGGMHEWCMVCEARRFRGWDVPVSEIHRFTTRTIDLNVTVPGTTNTANHFSGPHDIMSEFHVALRELIVDSGDLATFNSRISGFMDDWNVDHAVRPALPVRTRAQLGN